MEAQQKKGSGMYMEAAKRREAMLALLRTADTPMTGSTLAARFAVSRQVVVQDIALLRASGADITATPDGYLSPRTHDRPTRVLACRHTGLSQLREELVLIVDCGGTIEDILVEHPIYGTLRGVLMISSRMQVAEFVEKPEWEKSEPLSTLTGGAHLHTITAASIRELDAIENALRTAGFLI
ncbi:MAG: transcription repressor NadR [Clostridia bacterium]